MKMIQQAHQSSGGNLCQSATLDASSCISSASPPPATPPPPRPYHPHSSPHQRNTSTDQVHPRVSQSTPAITRNPYTPHSILDIARVITGQVCSDVQSPHSWLGKKHIASHSSNPETCPTETRGLVLLLTVFCVLSVYVWYVSHRPASAERS